MKQRRYTIRILLLLALLSASVFAMAQDETKCYQISGFVPDSICKIYLYKSMGLGSRQLLDSAVVTDGSFTMSGTRPAYDLLSVGSGAMGLQFFNDRFTDEFYRLFMASRQTSDETKKKELEQQIAANQEAMNEYERAVIHDNRDNVIAAYYLESVSAFMDYEELSSVLDSTVYFYSDA